MVRWETLFFNQNLIPLFCRLIEGHLYMWIKGLVHVQRFASGLRTAELEKNGKLLVYALFDME